VVRVADRAPSHGRRALVVLLAQPALQVVRQLLYQIAAGDADGPVRRADIDDPGKHTRDDAELGHAGKCCGLLPAVRPRAVGGVCGTMAVRGREQHVPAEMRSLFVADWGQKRVDLWCRCNSLYLHHFQNGAVVCSWCEMPDLIVALSAREPLRLARRCCRWWGARWRVRHGSRSPSWRRVGNWIPRWHGILLRGGSIWTRIAMLRRCTGRRAIHAWRSGRVRRWQRRCILGERRERCRHGGCPRGGN